MTIIYKKIQWMSKEILIKREQCEDANSVRACEYAVISLNFFVLIGELYLANLLERFAVFLIGEPDNQGASIGSAFCISGTL